MLKIKYSRKYLKHRTYYIVTFIIQTNQRTNIESNFNWNAITTPQDNETRKPSYRWQTRATRKHAKIVPIRRAYNVVADNYTGLSSFV